MFTACGGDDEDSDTAAETTPTATVPRTRDHAAARDDAEDDEGPDPDEEPRTVPPEEEQGDEEAIRSEAVFTGKGGRLTPREIRVPAFIAIRVILRSTDGGAYSLTIERHQTVDRRRRNGDGRARARRPPAEQVVRGQEPAGQRPGRGVRRARPVDSST